MCRLHGFVCSRRAGGWNAQVALRLVLRVFCGELWAWHGYCNSNLAQAGRAGSRNRVGAQSEQTRGLQAHCHEVPGLQAHRALRG
jgi:hypothetical protein